MDRKAVARQTLEILKRGCYEQEGRTVEIAAAHKRSVEGSRLFTPEEGERILRSFEGRQAQQIPTWGYKNCSTVDAVLELSLIHISRVWISSPPAAFPPWRICDGFTTPEFRARSSDVYKRQDGGWGAQELYLRRGG